MAAGEVQQAFIWPVMPDQYDAARAEIAGTPHDVNIASSSGTGQ
jgi:hypothetical protein